VERVVIDLEQALDSRKKKAETWAVPVIATEAVNHKNVDRLYSEVCRHISSIRRSGYLESRRRTLVRKKLLSLVEDYVCTRVQQKLLAKVDIDKIVSDICAGKIDLYTASQELCKSPVFHGPDD